MMPAQVGNKFFQHVQAVEEAGRSRIIETVLHDGVPGFFQLVLARGSRLRDLSPSSCLGQHENQEQRLGN